MSTDAARTIFRFADFELDTVAYELRRKGRRLRLPRQPMDLLLLLLERPRELVSREEIARRLWAPGVCVDLDAGIHTAVLRIRQVLGESRESPRFLETVSGKGYRFIAPVERLSVDQAQPSAEVPASADSVQNVRRHNLPAELTSFVGRRKELTELRRLLTGSRLLSLTGDGGVGKTRLAVRLVSELGREASEGVWLIDLAPLTTPALIAQTIATLIGVRESAYRSVREALVEYVRHREVLLILDTCEHLIDACAELVEVLLREAPRLRIVATSREALGVPGEAVFRVPSLSVPSTSAPLSADALRASEATQLFVERATAIDPGFTPSAANAGSIVRICHRLDGIPLPIELAAARVVMLSPEQIEARLHDRFRLLTGGTRTAIARQRTLEATVDWSYQLLSDVERTLFGRLSVFPASWTLDAAESVCAGDGIDVSDVLDLLSRLVSKSLVTIEADMVAERRYRFLETVRQYARERLMQSGTSDRVRDRHFEFYFNEFRGAMPILRHHDQVACLRRLRVEQENIRSALEWGLSSPPYMEQGLELAGALFWFWTKRGLFEEGRLWLERALAVGVDAPARLRAVALIGLGHMDHFQGRQVETAARATQALALGSEDAWVLSFALFMQALAAHELHDLDQARARAVEALKAANACDEIVQRSGPLMILGNVALASGDHERAQQLYEEAIDTSRRAGDTWGLGILLSVAAGLRIVRGDFDRAHSQAAEALARCHELEDTRGVAWSLEVFAGLLAARGHAESAAQLWGAADGLLDSVGGSLTPTVGWIRDRYAADVNSSLGDDAFEQARATGRTMLPEQAIALAHHETLFLTSPSVTSE
jgi:predicted ATPase/DNA-binding winged helix-turn-helix (wHTH) protein